MTLVAQRSGHIWPNGECIFAGRTRFSGLRDRVEDVSYCTSNGKRRGYPAPGGTKKERLGTDNWVLNKDGYQLKINPQTDCLDCPFYQPR